MRALGWVDAWRCVLAKSWQGGELMQQTALCRLKDFFDRLPFMRGGPVASDELQAAAQRLGVNFTPDYCEFVEKFGGALVGAYPLYGLSRAEPMDAQLWSVVQVTEHFRSQQWSGLESGYVVSMDHAGNPIWIDDEGVLRSFDHDNGESLVISQDLGSYLLDCLSTT